jgi:hypothetical protein
LKIFAFKQYTNIKGNWRNSVWSERFRIFWLNLSLKTQKDLRKRIFESFISFNTIFLLKTWGDRNSNSSFTSLEELERIPVESVLFPNSSTVQGGQKKRISILAAHLSII